MCVNSGERVAAYTPNAMTSKCAVLCSVERFKSLVESDSLFSFNDVAVKAAVSTVCYVQM